MITAAGVQQILLGAGGFLGTTMAGVGFFRLCNSTAKRIGQIPVALSTAGDELSKLREAIESDQTMKKMVIEQGVILADIREKVQQIQNNREEVSRELRSMSRKIEGVTYEQG